MRFATTTEGDRYGIGKILCIGRNYVDHIKELGNETPDRPVVFLKPSTAAVAEGATVVIPRYSSDCHHEGELALLVGTEGKNFSPGSALSHIAGYGAAIDFTLRDVQNELKKKGLPWEIAKAFDGSCPLSLFVPAAAVTEPHDLTVRLSVNGQVRQEGSTGLMIHRIADLVAYLSTVFTLEPGDVILTGTPAGVAAVRSGDMVKAEIVGLASVTVRMAD